MLPSAMLATHMSSRRACEACEVIQEIREKQTLQEELQETQPFSFLFLIFWPSPPPLQARKLANNIVSLLDMYLLL